MRLMGNADMASEVGLDRRSTVLLINTEDATAPALYRELVGESAEAGLLRQKGISLGEHFHHITTTMSGGQAA